MSSSGRTIVRSAPSGIVDRIPQKASRHTTDLANHRARQLPVQSSDIFTTRRMRIGIPTRGQEPRVPGRADPGRRARARRARPRGARPGGRRARQRRIAGRRLRGGGRADRRRRRRGLGGRPTCCSRSRSRSPQEYHRLRKDQVLFTYLHLAASRACTDALLDSGTTAIAYETVQLPDRLPAAARPDERGRGPARPAGRRVPPDAPPRAGAACCWAACPASPGAKVVVIGGGVSGQNAAAIAVGMRRRRHRARPGHRQAARDRRPLRRPRSAPSPPTPTSWSGPCLDADLVIGAVLVPGARAPKLVTNELVSPHEARLRARRHRDRPGRLLRGLAADHARRPDLPGARLGLLLRRQHARRRPAHLHLRADQRDAAVRRRRSPTSAGATPCAPTPRSRRACRPTRARCQPEVGQAHDIEVTDVAAVLS